MTKQERLQKIAGLEAVLRAANKTFKALTETRKAGLDCLKAEIKNLKLGLK